MNIWLKELSINDGKEYFDVLMTLSKYPDVFARPVPEDFTEEEYPTFLDLRCKLRNGEIKGYIPANTYWVMLDDKPIGYAILKHNANLEKPGGHFGCSLLKEYQNKGIGLVVSEMLSKIAYDELKLDNVIYTSKDENIQSQKSLDKIGATLVSTHDGYRYYVVNLKEKYENMKGR